MKKKMKKLFFVLVVLFGLGIFEASAQQEVRGIEVKVVEYEGEKYSVGDLVEGEIVFTLKTLWYGWELKNHNSIPVSVDVEIWVVEKEDELVGVESVVLNSGETHLVTIENNNLRKYYLDYYGSGKMAINSIDRVKKLMCIKYKAYRLE